jgi:hypothetical protein
MAKLILKRFQCVVDTDELGSESPYFLTYVGDIRTEPNKKSKLKITRQGNWENEVDKGETWVVNETVAEGFDLIPSKTVVLSAMVEEDEGWDISSSDEDMIRNALDKKLADFRSAGVTNVNGAISSAMAATFKAALTLALSTASGADDDYMGIKRVTLTGHTGDLKPVPFKSGGGHYNVRYTVA